MRVFYIHKLYQLAPTKETFVIHLSFIMLSMAVYFSFLFCCPSCFTVKCVRIEISYEIQHTCTSHFSWLLLYAHSTRHKSDSRFSHRFSSALFIFTFIFFPSLIPFSIWPLKTECHSIRTGFRLIKHWWHALWLRWHRHNSLAAPFRWVLTLGKYDVLLTVQQNRALCKN